MSSNMSDPTDSNMFQSPLLLADQLASDGTFIPIQKANGSSERGKEALSVDFEGWPCFLCNPSPGKKVDSMTGRMVLEGLEHAVKNHDTMATSTFISPGDGKHPAFNRGISLKSFSGTARDNLMIISQPILHWARQISIISRISPQALRFSVSSSHL